MSAYPAQTRHLMYCRRCDYVLDGLSELRCPECAQVFDPARRRTYSRRPGIRRWVRRAFLLTMAIVCLVPIGTAIVSGWMYWRLTIDREARATLAAPSPSSSFRYSTQPLEPTWLTQWITRWGLPRPEVVRGAIFTYPTDNDLRQLHNLPDLRVLRIWTAAV